MIFAVFDVLLAVNMCINYSFFYIYSTIKSKDTEVLGGLRARPNEIKARSSRPTWKNCLLWLCNVHCWNATQYYSTETLLLIFPFLQTNITVQMRPSGVYVMSNCQRTRSKGHKFRSQMVKCQGQRSQSHKVQRGDRVVDVGYALCRVPSL